MTNLRWLDQAPTRPTGITWGVPFAQTEAAVDSVWHLRRADGTAIPTQSWPLARWPDGSLKWLALAAVVGPEDGQEFSLLAGTGPAPAQPVSVHVLGIEIFRQVRTGAMTVDVGDRGTAILQQIVRHAAKNLQKSVVVGVAGADEGGKDRCVSGTTELVCRLQHRRIQDGREICETEDGLGLIQRLSVEQSGPIRAVIRLDGVHRMKSTGRQCLPFTLRLAFWAGLDAIDVVHSITFDGDPGTDFIAGLGLRSHVPLLDTIDNRHIRFAGTAAQDGKADIWCESARYAHLNAPVQRQNAQIAAQRVEPRGEDLLLPAWDSFRLEQDSADHCVISKRQAGPVCWIDASHGDRAAGLASLSDPGGGIAIGLEDFWERHPTALAAEGITGTESTLTAWFWSDLAQPMDLRHYGTRDYRPVYEAVNPDPAVYSSALGIAHTSRLRIWALGANTTHQDLQACTQSLRNTPLLVCLPQQFCQTQVLGPLSPVDRSTPARKAVEDELEAQRTFYKDQVEARRWYGFWNFGDVMHTYDAQRHVWRYDIGGCAWNNDELGTSLWLWYDFLRSGQQDAFRLAKNMTRHVSDVDSFHLGVWKGQGSRHNVIHWGCPCKEPRVSSAGSKRFLYYLTADERIADLLDEVADAHLGRSTNVPNDPTLWEARIGPVWTSFCANWLAAWERSGDARWKEKILNGITGILASPHGLLTGTPFTFDPASGTMTYAGDHSYAANRLVSVFGGAEVWMELSALLDHPAFTESLAEYGRIHALPKADFDRLPESLKRTISLRYAVAKLAAFDASRRGDQELAQRVWELLLHGDEFGQAGDQPTPRAPFFDGPEPLRSGSVQESNYMTMHDSQWALNAILSLALAPNGLDTYWKEKGMKSWPA